METISPVALKTKLDAEEKPVLLDVREAWEYALCSIEGSVNISISSVAQMLNELKADDETIVICHHGMRSFKWAIIWKATASRKSLILKAALMPGPRLLTQKWRNINTKR